MRTSNQYNDENSCPDWLFKYLNEKFNFSYDLACSSWNQKTKNGICFDKGFDSFRVNWSELNKGKYNYCFPPISIPNLQRFLRKAHEERNRGAKTVMLVPLKTLSTVYYDRCRADEIIIINPKVRFIQGGSTLPNGDATVILVYNKDLKENKITYKSFCEEYHEQF